MGSNYGTIATSYVAGGTVRARWHVGGLVGRIAENGIVIASYADVFVDGLRDTVGGLVGFMENASIVSASYAIGEVRGRNEIGGLAGERHPGSPGLPAEIQASYFDTKRSRRSSCCGVGAPSSDADTVKTSDQLRDPTTAVGTIYAGWDRLNVDGVDSAW